MAESGIDFKSVTTGGVAQSKTDRSYNDMTDKAKKAREYSDIKTSMDPEAQKKKSTNAEKQLKKAYLQSMTDRLAGKSEDPGPSSSEEPSAYDQERMNLIRKIGAYYTLPRHKNRVQIQITPRTSNDQLKAEVYDLENELTGGSPELVFFCMAKFFSVLENVSNRGNNFAKLDLTGLGQQIEANQTLFVPIAQEISIKYSDYWPKSGVWGRFLSAGMQVGYHTHKLNTDPEYRRQVEAAKALSENSELAEKMQAELNARKGKAGDKDL